MNKFNDRKCGMDLLKNIAALMVVMLHYIGYSGRLDASTASIDWVAYLLESISIPAVNIFVLTTSYQAIRKNHKEVTYGVKRFISLWITTLLISICILAISIIFGNTLSIFTIVCSVLPISSKAYWFVTVFACFLLVLPLLNRAVDAMNNRLLLWITFVLLSIYCVVPTLLGFMAWREVHQGYTIVWFVTLFFVTATYDRIIRPKVTWRFLGAMYVTTTLTIFASVIVLKVVFNGKVIGQDYIIENYASIPVFIQSVSLFALLADARIQSSLVKKCCKFSGGGHLSAIYCICTPS